MTAGRPPCEGVGPRFVARDEDRLVPVEREERFE